MSYAYRVMKDIRVAYVTFVRMTGKEPNAIYLGKNEVDWLKGMPGLMQGVIEPGKDQIAGMPLYIVDRPSHLAVGFVIHGRD